MEMDELRERCVTDGCQCFPICISCLERTNKKKKMPAVKMKSGKRDSIKAQKEKE